jgi:hypothetical protein
MKSKQQKQNKQVCVQAIRSQSAEKKLHSDKVATQACKFECQLEKGR